VYVFVPKNFILVAKSHTLGSHNAHVVSVYFISYNDIRRSKSFCVTFACN